MHFKWSVLFVMLTLIASVSCAFGDELQDTFDKVNKNLYGIDSGNSKSTEEEAPAEKTAPRKKISIPADDEASEPAPQPVLPAAKGGSGGYLGCFKDESRRDLKEKEWSDGKMTPEKCVSSCREEGFPYAGVQYGSYCFCGNRYGKYGQINEKKCNMPCSGDSDLDCGGSWANRVFSVSGAAGAPEKPLVESVKGGKGRYLGCFKDESRRDLKEKEWSDGKMTPEKCISYCREEGFQYAGAQYGSYCFCGNRYGKYGQIPEKSCKSPCSGDSDLDCGGSWANSVYSVSE